MVGNIDKTAQHLRRIISKISTSSATLHGASNELGSASEDISKSTRELSGHSVTVAAAAEEMSSNMNNVAAATEEASTNISIVATSTEDLTKTIQEIAENTDRTQHIIAKAITRSKSTSERVNELGVAASRIGKVTEAVRAMGLMLKNGSFPALHSFYKFCFKVLISNKFSDLYPSTN